jgi:hypothetical protein
MNSHNIYRQIYVYAAKHESRRNFSCEIYGKKKKSKISHTILNEKFNKHNTKRDNNDDDDDDNDDDNVNW